MWLLPNHKLMNFDKHKRKGHLIPPTLALSQPGGNLEATSRPLPILIVNLDESDRREHAIGHRA